MFLTGRDYPSRPLRQGLRFRRGCRSPKVCWPRAVTSPQLGALDRSDEFVAHRFFRLYLNQRLVADLGRGILRVCTRRKTDCGKNEQRPHRDFPFALQPLLHKPTDQIRLRRLAIFLNESLNMLALRRTALAVRFSTLAIVSTLFALKISAWSSLSCAGVQGVRSVAVISPSPSARARPGGILNRLADGHQEAFACLARPTLISA